MQICKRLTRDTWGNTSIKLRINTMRLLSHINSSHYKVFKRQSKIRNTWVSNVKLHTQFLCTAIGWRGSGLGTTWFHLYFCRWRIHVGFIELAPPVHAGVDLQQSVKQLKWELAPPSPMLWSSSGISYFPSLGRRPCLKRRSSAPPGLEEVLNVEDGAQDWQVDQCNICIDIAVVLFCLGEELSPKVKLSIYQSI